MKALDMDEHRLAHESGVDITLIRKYLNEDPSKHVHVGEKNAPRIAKALNLDTIKLLYGPRAA